MTKILAVVPHLEDCGGSTELLQLAGGLDGPDRHFKVISLFQSGPIHDDLTRSGFAAECLGYRGRWDLPKLLIVRRLIAEYDPGVIHVWGLQSLRIVQAALGASLRAVVLSRPLPAEKRGRLARWLDRRLIQKTKVVITSTEAEAIRCRNAGIDAKKITVNPPALSLDESASPASAPVDVSEFRSHPTVVCVGPVERSKGFFEAIWAYDVLRHQISQLRLCVVGEGRDLSRLRHFTKCLRIEKYVRFLGRVRHVQPILANALTVWAPSRADAGQHVVLEAMAAGKPVICSGLPDFAELVQDGKAGYLVPPGDQIAFSKRTAALVGNTELCERLGDTGRAHVQKHHDSAEFVRCMKDLYEKVAA